MKARMFLLMVWMWSAATASFAAAPTPSNPLPTVAKAPAKRATGRTTTARSTTASKPAAKSTKSASTSKSSTVGAKGVGREAPRTLQDIHIEGEIPVPQVLFITARDQRRFLDFKHRRYLKTSQQVGEQTALPSWIGVTGRQPTDAGKENPR